MPIEIRLYVDTQVALRGVNMPELEGEGFTKQKMPEPRQEVVERDDRLLSFDDLQDGHHADPRRGS